MSAPAYNLGTLFETVDMRVEPGRTLTATGDVVSRGTLRELPLLDASRAGTGIRAFRAHGDGLRQDGVRDGDVVIIDARRPANRDAVVVASVAGCLVIARVRRNVGATVELAPANPASLPFAQFVRETDVLGALAGIIRKHGFAPIRSSAVSSARSQGQRETEASSEDAPAGARPPGKLGILRGRLGMLEMTCASTKNLRLRRALKKEADRVRRLLQNETITKPTQKISGTNSTL